MQKESLDITNMKNLVSICYSTWFDEVHDSQDKIYDINEMKKKNPESPEYGPVRTFHYWAKPKPGYYRSDDESVMDEHMKQLGEAGIDFVVIDGTNIKSKWTKEFSDKVIGNPVRLMAKSIRKRRDEGEFTPSVVFWMANFSGDSDPDYGLDYIYEGFIKSGEYDDILVKYHGKPFVITTDNISEKYRDIFTMRKMWGLQQSLEPCEWSFLQPHPQNVTYCKGEKEHICVCAALQLTYMTAPTAITRKGGETFARQWKRCFDERPKITTLTWWNEWVAFRFEDENGNTVFTDNYDPEASRDIEPMEGGHGDLYYIWMKKYIENYKNGDEFPEGLIQK